MKLLLEIQPGDGKPFEVPCPNVHDVDGMIDTGGQDQYGQWVEEPCACKGTGIRLAELVGQVPQGQQVSWAQWDSSFCGTLQGYAKYYGWEWVARKIIADHRSGILPCELYKSDTNPNGLEEVL